MPVKAMRRGTDVLTVSVRLTDSDVQILNSLLLKYGGGLDSGSFSARFRNMIRKIDNRSFEHVNDPPYEEEREQLRKEAEDPLYQFSPEDF
jgi:hypothetical protein